jgi:hypothetical protein
MEHEAEPGVESSPGPLSAASGPNWEGSPALIGSDECVQMWTCRDRWLRRCIAIGWCRCHEGCYAPWSHGSGSTSRYPSWPLIVTRKWCRKPSSPARPNG